jgi:spore coat polysaccharide biosynthesis protein SpsF (cytidylyltransferase family)
MFAEIDKSIKTLETVIGIFEKYSLIFENVYKFATLEDKARCFQELNKLFVETEKHYEFLKELNSYNEFVDHINEIFDKFAVNEDISKISEMIHQYHYENNVLIAKLTKAIS